MQPHRPFAISTEAATSTINHTGTWRTQRPVYVSNLPPCNHACPAGENIQAWLARVEEGRIEEAWRLIMEDNPFPAVMGRVCYHPCQTICNRAKVDEAVGINSVERFLGDQGLIHQWKIEPGPETYRRVMIIGAGPAGLSAAYHLRRFGHTVTVFDSNPKPGGLIRYGIPRYRMPREKLTAEIARIEAMGVEIRSDFVVRDVLQLRKAGHFDAVFLAVGAPLAQRLAIPAVGAAAPVLDALQVLRDAELDNPTELRGRVVVYGGGNTAMDVARSAVRFGVLSATVVVRRDRAHLRAHPEEVHEALEEGAELLTLRTVNRIDGPVVHLERMVMGSDGKPRPLGEFEELPADLVVEAAGQRLDLPFLSAIPGLRIEDDILRVDDHMSTGVDGVFAGGDLVHTNRTVTEAIGHGKKAARNIDAYLRGEKYQHPPRRPLAVVANLEPWYYTDAPRSHRPRLELARRTSGFAEVVGNLDEQTAVYESRRCMSCGNCFECDNCYGMCPDNAVRKLGPGRGFEFNYDYCKGCGICASECPCGAIEMTPEER